MNDPWNPTADEVDEWGSLPDATWPIEDWDIAVADERLANVVFQLASTPSCPNRFFFLRCLYLFAGDAVRSDFQAHSRAFIETLLANVTDASPAHIQRWASRTVSLVAAGSVAVDYVAWCDGGYARAEEGNGG